MGAMAQRYQLSDDEKIRIANRINYFRVMPKQILYYANELEKGQKVEPDPWVNYEEKSVCVNGKIMILGL